MSLFGGKWGEASCAHCNRSLGAAITCPHCEFINEHVDSVYTSPERVEKTAESIHDCGGAQHHRYADHIADAGKVIAEPVKQEPVAVVKKSLTTELVTDALTSILKMDVKGYELQERLQFSTSGRQLLEKAKNALSSIEAIDSIEKPIDAKAIRAEALEEAAQWFEGNEDDVGYAIATEIRGLK